MRKTILFFFLIHILGLSNESYAQTKLLKELDQKIKNRQYYMNLKEEKIDSLRNLLSATLEEDSRYHLNQKIYEEYATYHFDSAMNYIIKNQELAEKLKNITYTIDTKLDYVSLLSTSGLIKEAFDVLESVDSSQLENRYLIKYYKTSDWTYHRARVFANDTLFAPTYFEKVKYYVNATYQKLSTGDPQYLSHKGYLLMLNEKWDQAEEILHNHYQNIDVATREYAIVTYYLASIYKEKNNIKGYKEFLIRSAISDQMCALKENTSLQLLAIYLYQNEPDQIERAYQYLQTSLNDARFFNNRVRAVQIGYNLPVVASAYQAKSQKENKRLKTSVIVISILMILMAFILGLIYKQMKQISRNRRELLSLNDQLTFLNKSLNEANKTKEEYVRLFVDLCSSYIDQINNYRKMVLNKIVANQVNDLLTQARSSEKTDFILLEFFQNFDKAFLKLYPTFIEDLNLLLNDDAQITLKEGELLSTELRIFALIRLGISDSAKIAAFLRYSPQTIYNYRTKLRNKAKDSRDDFEEKVMTLGI